MSKNSNTPYLDYWEEKMGSNRGFERTYSPRYRGVSPNESLRREKVGYLEQERLARTRSVPSIIKCRVDGNWESGGMSPRLTVGQHRKKPGAEEKSPPLLSEILAPGSSSFDNKAKQFIRHIIPSPGVR